MLTWVFYKKRATNVHQGPLPTGVDALFEQGIISYFYFFFTQTNVIFPTS